MRFKHHAPFHDGAGTGSYTGDAEGLDRCVELLFFGGIDGVFEVGAVHGAYVGDLNGAQFLGSTTMSVNMLSDLRAEQSNFKDFLCTFDDFTVSIDW